jgi:hypothetical protein
MDIYVHTHLLHDASASTCMLACTHATLQNHQPCRHHFPLIPPAEHDVGTVRRPALTQFGGEEGRARLEEMEKAHPSGRIMQKHAVPLKPEQMGMDWRVRASSNANVCGVHPHGGGLGGEGS